MQIVNYEYPEEAFRLLNGYPSIFLAGPTARAHQRDAGMVSWRDAAIKELKKQNFDGIVFSPEFHDWNKSSELDGDTIMDWEDKLLNMADSILFWIPRTQELIGLTTNFEMGYWLAKHSGKVVYGRPEKAYKTRYCDFMWKRETERNPDLFLGKDRSIHTILENTVSAAIYVAESRFKLTKGYV